MLWVWKSCVINYSCLSKSINIFLLTKFPEFLNISQLFYIIVTLNYKNYKYGHILSLLLISLRKAQPTRKGLIWNLFCILKVHSY